ncbi:MAG: acetamidase [Candidatus Aramenus sulfurataquae]|uniref:Acetamidase n=1 Tax=Candidatus Aramenus sulfurataquae TaxID=1326980 RepID=W7KGY4_9CREN|nr:MAG: acetamidase [Candidatus Aramenus sulfurataquae]
MLTIHAVTHNKWDNSLKPIASVKDGDVIEVETKEASDGQITPSSTVEDLRGLNFDLIHPLTGPIEVEGAEPGDAVEVEFLEFKDMGWGWTAVIPGFGFLAQDSYTTPMDLSGPGLKIWKSDGEHSRATFGNIHVKVRNFPFPGVIGTALRAPGRWSTIPPRENGGNMDVKHLTVGSRVILPVFKRGALLSIGDTHLAQGDGEVCGSAIEAPLTVKLRVRLIKNAGISQPIFYFSKVKEMDYDEYLAYPGMSPNLWEASKIAVKGIISILSRYMTPLEAYMLSSATLDLKVSQVVDVPNWIVTAYFPLDVIEEREVREELRELDKVVG